MRKKLGLKGEDSNDKELIVDLLSWMHQNKVGCGITCCHLMNKLNKKNEIYNDQKFILWKKKWEKRRLLNKNSIESSLNLMSESNPLVIPRNYLVEEALNDAVEKNDLKKVNTLLEVIKDPYKETSLTSFYQSEPDTKKEKYQTFCGT